MGVAGAVVKEAAKETMEQIVKRLVINVCGEGMWEQFLKRGASTLPKEALGRLATEAGEKGIRDLTKATMRDLLDKGLLKNLSAEDALRMLDDVAKQVYTKQTSLARARGVLLRNLEVELTDTERAMFIKWGTVPVKTGAGAALELPKATGKFAAAMKELASVPALEKNVKYPLLELMTAKTAKEQVAAVRALLKAAKSDLVNGISILYDPLAKKAAKIAEAGLEGFARAIMDEAKELDMLLRKSIVGTLNDAQQKEMYRRIEKLVEDVGAFNELAAKKGLGGQVLTGDLEKRWKRVQLGREALQGL